MSYLAQFQKSLFSEQFNEKNFKNFKDSVRISIMLFFLAAPYQSVQIKIIQLVIMLIFISIKTYNYFFDKTISFSQLFDIQQVILIIAQSSIMLASKEILQKQQITKSSDQTNDEFLQDMILINDGQQSIIFILILQQRFTLIIQLVAISSLITSKINYHQLQKPFSDLKKIDIIISHSIGFIQLVIGVIMYIIIDIELQRLSEESKLKDTKVMKVVHDLKNPILSLKNMIDKNSQEDNKNFLHLELGDMEEMLDDLRTEFKFKNNMKFNEAAGLVKTKDLIQSLMHTHSSLAEAQKNFIKYSVEIKFPNQIILERSIVKRILNNFISNALKHARESEVQINFYTEELSTVNENILDIQVGDKEKCVQKFNTLNDNKMNNDSNDKIYFTVFEVRDTGVGIPQDILPQVFDEKVSDQNDANWEGTGLGLSICSYLISEINGFIKYNSFQSKSGTNNGQKNSDINPDNITQFKLYLPLKPGYLDEMTEKYFVQHDYRTKFNQTNYNDHKCNFIIIVEDNTSIMKMQERIFKSENMNYKLFKNGQDCLKFINLFNLNECSCKHLTIVTDQFMLGMTGYELASTVRKMNFNVKLKIMLATAESCLNIDNDIFDEVWEKPITSQMFKLLYERIQDY